MEEVIRAINMLDLKTLPLEMVELLQRMVPTEAEVSHQRSQSFQLNHETVHRWKTRSEQSHYTLSKYALLSSHE